MLYKRLTLLVPVAFVVLSLNAGDAAKKRWDMDYGPLLGGTFRMEVTPATGKPAGEDYKKSNDGYVLKGLTVRLDREKQACVCYDEETMRLSGAWAGGFIDYNGVIFAGEHHAQPRVKGALHFTAKNGPGWAKDGSFTDPRAEQNGPLPPDWMKFKGYYFHGEKVIFSYTVADCKVLEMPGVSIAGNDIAFVRTFNLEGSSKPLVLHVGGAEGLIGRISPPDAIPGINADTGPASSNGPAQTRVATLTGTDKQFVAGIVGAPEGSEWEISNGQILLKIPALKAPVSFKVVIAASPGAETGKIAAHLKGSIEDLSALTKGGPARWTDSIKTQGTLGSGDGPYLVDTITAPDSNPWNSWIRFGGLDFFADNKRAALCTWSGDVWIVSGIDETLQNLTWKRYATGLYQPLGLKIVNEKIYCTCRDQIVRLHDLNNDDEADFYECFNNDCLLTRHFHEFSLDLQTDAQGNFYYAKGATPGRGGPNFDLWTIHNGGFFKLPPDGSKLEVIARGLRAPNGIAIGPNGEMTSGDNEGSWVPSCPINIIKPGGFVGIPEGVPGLPKPTKRDDPLCWLPKEVDNSSGGQVWVTSDKWGPFKGHMLHMSYGKSSLFKVLWETVNGSAQGGVVRFPINFASGVMRARFNSADGQLYLCGMKGWQTTAARDGIFQRVRYTGKPVHMPIDMKVTKTGIDITFTSALDATEATNADNYSGQQFNLRWKQDYGSPEFSVVEPEKKARDPITIKSVKLSADGKTVSLEIPELKRVYCMVLKYKIKAADGTLINQQINNTINVVP
jgi:hypothetical protein